MSHEEFSEELKKALQPILDADAIELVEFVCVKTKKALLLKLLVERREGGISLGDCVKLNKKIRNYLDTTNIAGQDYTLEVSSPGADRPLKTKKDFLRGINKRVKIFLKEAINGKIETNGIIVSVEDDNVGIDVSGTVLKVPLDNVLRAKQVIE